MIQWKIHKLFALILLALTLGSCSGGKTSLSDRPIVKVNSERLTAKAFADELAYRLRAYDALSVKDEMLLNRTKQEVVRNFIVRVISETWAKQKGLFVRREDLDKYVDGVRGHYPDDLAFRRSLTQENLTFKDWRERVKFSLLQKLIMKELNRTRQTLTDEELKKYYKTYKDQFKEPAKVRLRQVVQDSKNNAERMQKLLRQGKSFKSIAKKFSITPESQSEGDIGWIEKGTLDIFDEAFKMRPGQRSPILKSDYGYHIFEVIAMKKAKTIPFEVAKSEVRRRLEEKREQALYSAWLEGQVRKASVFKDEKLITSIKVETRGVHNH